MADTVLNPEDIPALIAYGRRVLIGQLVVGAIVCLVAGTIVAIVAHFLKPHASNAQLIFLGAVFGGMIFLGSAFDAFMQYHRLRHSLAQSKIHN